MFGRWSIPNQDYVEALNVRGIGHNGMKITLKLKICPLKFHLGRAIPSDYANSFPLGVPKKCV